MAFVIKVKQATQIQTMVNGQKRSKTLLPDKKYIISDANNSQISDLKKLKCLTVKTASAKEESSFENLRLK